MAKENLNELIVGMHNREVERIREAQKKEEEQRQEQDRQRRKKTRGELSLFEQVANPVLPEEKISQAARKAELTRAQREEQRAAQQLENYKQSGRRSADWDKAVSDAMAAINPGMGNLDLQLMQAASNTRNQTEDYYQAVADYFTRNRQAAEDRHLMENDVADVEAMSAEDRKLLETYAYGRSEWMDPKKVADSTAARAELEKKYGAKRVEELAESWQRHQSQLLAERTRQETQEQAGNGFFAGVGHSAASVAANALGSLSAPLGYLQEAMGRTGRYQTLDPNNPGALPGQYASAVRETVSEDMGGVGKVLYHGTMGAADNLARIALAAGSGPLALGLAAVGSFGSTVSEASARGATPGQAVLLGVANAGIEVATEKIGLDELFRAGKSGYKGAKAAFMQALRQGGIEAAEEELSFLGNILTDAAVMQGKSAYNQQIGELVANGMSYADAKNQANRALWDEAVNTAFTSFVSGGVMSGAQSGGQYVGQKIQERNATRNATVPENATVSKAETAAPTPENVPQESAVKDGMARVMEAAREFMGVDTAATGQSNQSINTGNIFGEKNNGDVKIGSGAAEVGMDHGAVGAAERGFSPKYELIDQYGNIPEGENPVRPDQLPRSVTGEDRVSYTARTALEAEATPDEFAELIENETVRGGFSYIPISNSETTQQAMAEISEAGWERSRGAWETQVRNGQTSAAMIATGALLYNHAVNSGDFKAAMDILMDYQQAARNAGQAVQAARILKTLSPENRLYMIQTSVRRMVEDMHLDREITIDENLARQYQQAYDPREADHILDLIAKDVAQQLPSNWRERFRALRYLSMLGNFRTQVRNWVGNVTNQGLYMAKDQLAATIEGLANAASGGRLERTKVNFTDRATRRAAAADYENVADWISGGGRTNDRMDASTDFARRVQENRRIFRFAPLEGYRKATDWAMNNRYFGDAAFGRANYARALAGYLNARGIKTDNLDTVSPEVLNAAREYAVRQAQEATFRDNNQVSEFVSGALRGKNTPAWARVIGEAVMPFRKTPANVLVRAEEFSPLGLINSAVNTVRAARGDISGAELVDSWAKSITGTGLFAIGWALANMGMLRGGPDEDEDKAAFDKLNGMQDYALMLPDGTNLTIDAFSPTAMPLLLGAQLDKILEGEELSFADLEGMMSTLADPMIEMSMLSGLNDTIDAIRYADNSLGQFLVNAAFNYLTQALGNTLLGQMERSTEESRMTTYIDKDSAVPAWLQRNLGKLSQKVPLWDYNQTEYIDQWGREQKNPEGIKNWLYQMLSPSYIDKAEVDGVAEELYRLHEATGENVFPQSPETTITYTDKDGNRHEKYNLSAEEADKLKRVQGQTHAKLVADLVESEDFAALTDDQKAKAAILCRDYAKELARGEVLPGYDGIDSWMEGIEGNEAGSIIAKVTGADLGDAMSSMTTAWKSGKDSSEAVQSLEEAYQTYKGLSEPMRETVFEGLSERVRDYIGAREAGQDAADYLKVQKAVTQADHYMDQMAEALKKDGTGEEHFDALDQLYESYAKMDYNDREAVKEKASSKVKYFLEARTAGVPTQTFSGLYNEFSRIQDAEDASASDKATQWAHALQKAREAGRITQTQADKLREAMGMWQVIPAKADAYANLTGEGLSADDADNLLRILDQIQGTGKLDEETGQRAITDLDRLQGIAGASFLTTQERDAAMKLYMPDYDPKDESPNKTELKYDYARQELGLTAAEYVEAYRAYVENNRKRDKSLDAWEELGFTAQEAAMLWRLFGASGSAKIDVEAWYNEK